jgi:SAM-dependent methyltransferase
MKPREIYDELFFDSFDDIAQSSAQATVPLVLERVPARSVIDVGCGRGYWLREFKRCGVEHIFGVDGGKIEPDRLVISPDEFASVDLSRVVHGEPLNVSDHERFDLASCMEVAEHLPPAAAASFVRALAELAPALLFSAAIPRQGGTGHINEQWPSYWARLFAEHGFVPIDGLRQRIWGDPGVGVWYRQNLLMYIRQDRLGDYPAVAPHVVADVTSLDIAHPEYYESQFPEQRSIRELAGPIMHATVRRVRSRIKSRAGT